MSEIFDRNISYGDLVSIDDALLLVSNVDQPILCVGVSIKIARPVSWHIDLSNAAGGRFASLGNGSGTLVIAKAVTPSNAINQLISALTNCNLDSTVANLIITRSCNNISDKLKITIHNPILTSYSLSMPGQSIAIIENLGCTFPYLSFNYSTVQG